MTRPSKPEKAAPARTRRTKESAPATANGFPRRESAQDKPSPTTRDGSLPVAAPSRVAPLGAIVNRRAADRLRAGYLWVYASDVVTIVPPRPEKNLIPVADQRGIFLGTALWSPQSQIALRLVSREALDHAGWLDLLASRLRAAIARRKPLLDAENDACRLSFSEADELPGLIVDKYGDVLVMQLGSAGPERWRDTLADILQELCSPVCIYERSDSDGRELEGLPVRSGILRGTLPDKVEVTEHGILFAVDVAAGQKTGFYLDQRDNRALTGALAADRDVLNCFCYTGGFSLYALRGDAKSVLSIDSSQEALHLAQANVDLNGLDASRAEWQCADVFEALRKLRDQNRKFDLIVLDPPKFAPTAAFAEKASRAYKDINLLGFKLLRPGGLLFTYSCSGGISDDLFQKIIAGAALDAGVDAQIIKKLHAAADHPVLLSFPEGAYLKGLVLRVA